MTTTHTTRRRLGLTALVLLVVGCGGGVGDAGPVARFTGPPGASSSPPAVTGSTLADLTASPFATDDPGPSTAPAASPTAATKPSPTRTPRLRTPSPKPTPSAAVTTRPTHSATPVPTSTPALSSPTPVPGTPSPTPIPAVTLTVYFLLDDGDGAGGTLIPVSRTVEGTRAMAGAALRELLSGPTPAEKTEAAGGAAPYTVIPVDTLPLDLALADGIATVDLSREFEAGAESSVMARRLAQVVYTLTQFRTITGVLFKLDGLPVAASTADGTAIDGPAKRSDYVALLPTIFVDQPGWGAAVDRPIVLRGRANVSEASFQLQLTDDDGRQIDRRTVTPSCGSGCWGDWEVDLDITNAATERLWVTVWQPSAADGSPQNVRRYPIHLPHA